MERLYISGLGPTVLVLESDYNWYRKGKLSDNNLLSTSRGSQGEFIFKYGWAVLEGGNGLGSRLG